MKSIHRSVEIVYVIDITRKWFRLLSQRIDVHIVMGALTKCHAPIILVHNCMKKKLLIKQDKRSFAGWRYLFLANSSF